MSGDACQHYTAFNYKFAGYTVWWCVDCGGFKQPHTDAPGPKWRLPKTSEAPKQFDVDGGAIHVDDLRRALKQIDVLTQDVAALYDVAEIDGKRLSALSKQGEDHARLLAARDAPQAPDALFYAQMRIGALEAQVKAQDDASATLVNGVTVINKRLDAFAEQSEAQADTIAKLCEDVDMAKADTLRAHEFIDKLCELLSDMQRRTRGLP